MSKISVAILITSFNRVKNTLECFNSIYCAVIPNDICYEIFLVDDNSYDDTGEIIKGSYPNTNIIKGTGNLFWAGGMRLAWDNASKKDYDYYLWMNDDTYVYRDFWFTFYNVIMNTNPFEAILVGTTESKQSGIITYGGYKNNKFVLPNGDIQECDFFNGNCIFIPKNVFKIIGNIDEHFTHTIGDFDYGLRASKEGILSYVLPKIIGTCERTAVPEWANSSYSLIKRWEIFKGPKGMSPKEYFFFLKRHYSKNVFERKMKLYFRLLFPRMWNRLKNKPNQTIY